MRPSLEAIHRVSQAGRRLREIGRINLLDIAEAHDLGAGARARDQRLHLLRRQVLRLVNDQIARQEGPPAHEVQRADLPDRKSTRLNSSHPSISYAVFCLKKKIIS